MRNKRLIMNWILFFCWIGLIFFMSSQPGDISTKQSDLVIKIFMKLGIDLNNNLGEIATLVVRKTAHLGEYFILSIFTMNLFNYYFKPKSQSIYALVFIFLYASLDEIHQYFVPGRSMHLKDIIIDTLGGLIGILVYSNIISLKNLRKQTHYKLRKMFKLIMS